MPPIRLRKVEDLQLKSLYSVIVFIYTDLFSSQYDGSKTQVIIQFYRRNIGGSSFCLSTLDKSLLFTDYEVTLLGYVFSV